MTRRHSVVAALTLLALPFVFTRDLPGQPAASDANRRAAAPAPGAAAPAEHVIVRPEQVKWVDAPPGLPAGAKVAILEGDPAREGFFTMRAMFPDGYRIAPHWHPTIERITILSGTLHLGMGEQVDKARAQGMPAGTYGSMPAEMRHYAWTEGQTIVQISTLGPWGISYVNPADDPRQKKQ